MSLIDEKLLLYVALALCASAITYLSLGQKHKDLIISRLNLRGRRASTATTPPRSLSPDKKEPRNSPLSSAEYVTAFPPLNREALETVVASLPESQREAAGDLQFNENTWFKDVMALEDDYRSCDPEKYVFTGMKAREIRALGDFPDYATLSGVPLPDPYPEHDIKKALPRPYRPFRWSYHQTMCKLAAQSNMATSSDLLLLYSTNQNGNQLVDGIGKHICVTHCPTQEVVRRTWRIRLWFASRIRTRLQRTHGDGPSIPLRPLPAILYLAPR